LPLDNGPVAARAHSWRTLAALHARVEDALARRLRREHELSVSEYGVLDLLARHPGEQMRMNQLSNAIVLSQSATTRLVDRLEARGFVVRWVHGPDRRGVYTELTHAGQDLLDAARPTHDAVVAEELDAAEQVPELAPLVRALDKL
jgi:DNA-binding MarR family transcriptional regulator